MKSPLVPLQERLTEKFHALLVKCDLVADTAPLGKTFDNLETFFIDEGRTFIQHVFQEKLQERIEHTEDNSSPICPGCKKKTTIQDNKPKNIIAAYGTMKLWRDYHQCPECKNRSFSVEVTLGIPKRYSNGVKERVAYIIGFSSYRLVAKTLKLFLGFRLSPTTIGEIADQTADEMSVRLKKNADVRKDFQKAKGEIEFLTDGTCINTRNDEGKQEYREVKIAVCAKRECGESAEPFEWESRDLPEPNALYAVAAIEEKKEFQERCQTMRRFLGVGGITSALGDGALWIWSIILMVFGKTNECLDIYHALEKVSSCGKSLYGSGQALTEWFESMRNILLSEGLPGMERELELLKIGLKSEECKSVDSLLEYLRKNKDRLKYRERLAEGRAIGSGLIEGACKNLIGKRLKQTKACWRVERANKIASICAVLYSEQWERAWNMSN
jgi:hypothetical protein